METLSLNASDVSSLPENTCCLTWSDDGLYLSVGHSRGLSLWSATSMKYVADWSQDRLEITAVQMTKLADDAYLLGTIDDMGVARVLMFSSEMIHLLNIINKMEDINSRTICSSLQVSKQGDYGLASMRCKGDIWLEVLHFPTESWRKEVECSVSQKQDSDSASGSEVQWSPIIAVHKITPMTSTSENIAVFHAQFLSHILALDGNMSPSTGDCTAHFLLPMPGEGAEKSDLPNAVCVWWSGSQNLLHYSLQKAIKSKADDKPAPGRVWPNANNIICSAVSGCTRYIAVGLTDAVVCVWDRISGAPISTLSLSYSSSAFSKIIFMDNRPPSPDDSRSSRDDKLRLLALCKCGAMYAIVMGRGAKAHALQLAERAKDSSGLPTVAAAVPFLQGLALVIHRDGKMCLQDVINKRSVCSLILPPKHVLTAPCKPVFALNSRHRALLVQGGPDPLNEGDDKNQLYVFRFEECDIVKPYMMTAHSEQKETCTYSTLNQLCDRYLQERRMSSNERAKHRKQTWAQLQRTSLMLQQRQSAHHTGTTENNQNFN